MTSGVKNPVPIRGVVYESRAAASRALDVSVQTIKIAEKRGTLDKVGLNKAKGIGISSGLSQPITIRGVRYKSEAEACRKLNLSPGALYCAKKRGSLNRVGLGLKGGCKPQEFGGKVFKSIKAAAKHFGVTRQTMAKWIEKGYKEPPK